MLYFYVNFYTPGNPDPINTVWVRCDNAEDADRHADMIDEYQFGGHGQVYWEEVQP